MVQRTALQKGADSDIIIPIMGPTGVGKSTFISIAAGKEVAAVGHGLESFTAKIQPISFPYPQDPSRTLVLIDTPGFDDTYTSDTDILKRIADWLEKSYKKGKQLSGVIYLHEITQKRMSGSSRKNYIMFEKLCGKRASENVILATTKWDSIKPDLRTWENREKELEKFWEGLIREGSRTHRFDRTRESAWAIINDIIEHDRIDHVLIQEELVDLFKFLPETEAGLTLRCTLQELLEAHRKAAQDLRDKNDEQAKQRYADVQDSLKKTAAQIKELYVPISKRLLRWLGLT